MGVRTFMGCTSNLFNYKCVYTIYNTKNQKTDTDALQILEFMIREMNQIK